MPHDNPDFVATVAAGARSVDVSADRFNLRSGLARATGSMAAACLLLTAEPDTFLTILRHLRDWDA